MRFAFLISGILGFALVAIAGYSADRQSDLVLRDAAVACLVTGITGRWFWSVLDRAFAETMTARRAAADAEAEAQSAAPAKGAPSTPPAKPLANPPVKIPPVRPASASAPAGATR
ncbi:MAG: hypothetical protein WC661_04195 [Opitutaceae bacterium]|jgi:hypothetical protein